MINNRELMLKLVIVTLICLVVLMMITDVHQDFRGLPKDLPPCILGPSSWRLRLNESVSSAESEEDKFPSGVEFLPSKSGGMMQLSLGGEFKRQHSDSERGGGGGAGGTPDPVTRILVLSSIGRSGSTFMGEFVSQGADSVYFFEPELFIPRYQKEEVTPENTLSLILDMFDCRFSNDFIRWLGARHPSIVYRTNLTKDCDEKEDCLRDDLLTEDCQKTTLRVVKVIRMRLHWVRPLLKNSSLNLKVIHLVRDPRGSLASMARLGMAGREPEDACPRILMDIRAVSVLQKQFPGKVFSVQYENFFSDPEGTATDLWKFLHDIDSASAKQSDLLPLSWSSYLQSHTTKKVAGTYNTFRDSKNEMEAWRQEIDEAFLLEVEKHCKKVIRSLGHTIFGSLANAVNLNIPLARTASKVRPVFFNERFRP